MTYLYLFCAFFVAIWIPGMYTFLSQREIPAMAIREWPLKLLSNIFGLIYVIFMCFTLESYFDDVASFLPHCTTFLWFQFLYVPFLSMPTVIMHYTIEFFMRKRDMSPNDCFFPRDFFSRFKWTTTPCFLLVIFMSLSVILILPHVVTMMLSPPPNVNSPTTCFGVHIWINAIQSLLSLIIVFLLRGQLTMNDPYDIGPELDLFNKAAIALFPFFNFLIIYEYTQPKPVYSRYFTPFYSHLAYVVIHHLSTIWLPIYKTKLKKLRQQGEIEMEQEEQKMKLDLILNDEFAREQYNNYLTKMWLGGTLELYMDILEFKKADPNDRTEVATKIIEDVAFEPIKNYLDSSIVAKVKKGEVDPAIFDDLKKTLELQLIAQLEEFEKSPEGQQVKKEMSRFQDMNRGQESSSASSSNSVSNIAYNNRNEYQV